MSFSHFFYSYFYPPKTNNNGIIIAIDTIGQVIVSRPFLEHNSTNVEANADANAINNHNKGLTPPLTIKTVNTAIIDVITIAIDPS